MSDAGRPEPRTVVGVVQRYAWGDPHFIPELLGEEPDGTPVAELWLGTHPNGPTTFTDGTRLADATGPLPYLLKVLAAAEPLSLQVHPDAAQAADGFRRGIYTDSNEKPELLCALTRFEAFCGVRPPAATVDLLHDIGADELAAAVERDGPGAALLALYDRSLDPTTTIEACRASRRPEAQWASRLDERYPGEPSVVATLLLNHVVLEPGQALHLTAGNLHAYLGGAGIELMGASDNVVRGGLTVKPVDVDELVRILDPTPLADPVLEPAEPGHYRLPEARCTLVHLAPAAEHRSDGHELAIALDGRAWYLPPGSRFTATADTYVAAPDGPVR